MGAMAKISENISQDTDLTKLPKGDYVFFSPRDKSTTTKPSVHLQNYANLIDKADELVCMVFPFNMDDVFSKVYAKDKKYLRLLIFESASDAAAVKSNDTDLKVTAGKVYTGKEQGFVSEITAKATTGAGILYVHNKFFILDALTDHPVVLTGSANFSNNSIRNNDENSILIKGNTRVADIYLTEFDRLFTHFWPRYLKSLKLKTKGLQGFAKPLDETGTWHKDYFDSTRFAAKRKKLFQNMFGAKQG
jgi:phosphatidylserine/phosphatidylglycerophosphate/cardiolipin synthase-like enzyme